MSQIYIETDIPEMAQKRCRDCRAIVIVFMRTSVDSRFIVGYPDFCPVCGTPFPARKKQ